MPDAPFDTDPFKRQAKQFAASVRPHHIAVVAVISAVGLGVWAAQTLALPGPRPVRDSERMQIQVVAPVEPNITPGSVMEVGTLVEGFEYRSLPRPVVETAEWTPYDEGPAETELRPARRRYDERAGLAEVAPEPPPEAPEERRQDRRVERWFGFDAPERDYRAEREARRARMEARMERERERERREVRWYRSDGEPVGYDGRDDRGGRSGEEDDLRG